MTAPLEIPDAATEAVHERWSVLSGADDDQIAAVLEETDWGSYVAEELVRAAAPHLFAVFAERLTSDATFVRALHVELIGKGWSANGAHYLDAYRDLSEAVAAALVPSREGGRADG